MKHVLAFLLLTSSALGADFRIGPEFLPDYTDHYESKLIVPVGETATLAGSQDIDAIRVDGTLSIPGELMLRYINLTVSQGGKLTIGTAASPNTAKVEIIKKDAAIDTSFDPFGWGHGVQVFGHLEVHGRKLEQTWLYVDDLENFSRPADWLASDVLVKFGKRYEHGGETIARPVVGNTTRNIVFSSENSADITRRGHTAIVHTGSADVRYASFVGLGRTKGEAIDNTQQDSGGVITHVGTNQIARYGFHWHHAAHHAEGDHSGGHLIGCNLDGLQGNKWGVVIHQSDKMHVEGNVVGNFTGACIVTEDGPEEDYLIKRNLCYGSRGNGRNGKQNMLASQFAPGAEGSGIWLHGPLGTTVENCCVGNTLGYQFMYREQLGSPRKPDLNMRVTPKLFDGNVSIENYSGIEQWNSPTVVVENHVCVGNTHGVTMGAGEPGSMKLNNPSFIGKGTGNGVRSSAAYTSRLETEGGFMTGFEAGLNDANQMVIKGTDFRGNGLDVAFAKLPAKRPGLRASFDGIKWDTFRLETAINEGERHMWQMPDPKITLLNHGGKNYQLGTLWQASDYVVTSGTYKGLANQQVLDQHGLTPFGYIYSKANAVELPGLTMGVAVPLGDTPEPPDPPDPDPVDPTIEELMAEIERLKARLKMWEDWHMTAPASE